MCLHVAMEIRIHAQFKAKSYDSIMIWLIYFLFFKCKHELLVSFLWNYLGERNVELFRFCFWPMIPLIIHRSIITNFLPPTIITIIPNLKNQLSFVVAQKSLFVCLLNDRSQSLTLQLFFFFLFLINKLKNEENYQYLSFPSAKDESQVSFL